MKNIRFLLLISLVFVSCKKKSNGLNYKVYQYQKNDSSNYHLTKTAIFNKKGLIEYEKCIDYFTDGFIRQGDEEIIYYYNDTLLTKIIKKHINYYRKDSSRIEHLYDNKGVLVQKIFYEHYKPFKEGRIGCFVDSSDFEKNYIWKIIYHEHFKYKNKRLFEKRIPDFVNRETKYQFEYDKEERIIKENYYDNDELVSEKIYKYVENGYDLNSKGNWNGFEKYRFIKDKKGNIIQESKDWRGTQMYRIERKYNINNKLILERSYDRENKLELTSKYIYF